MGSYGIKVSFSSEDPKLAAKVANVYAQEYINTRNREAEEAAVGANSWLKQRLDELHNNMQQSTKELEKFRQDAGLIETRGVTVSAQQLSELNSRLVEARTERHLAEARYAHVKQLAQLGRAETAPEVLDSEHIQKLKQQQADLLKDRAERSMQYGQRHPTIININAELENVNRNIEAEIERIIERLGNEVEVARVREQELVRGLSALEGQVARDSMAQAGVRICSKRLKSTERCTKSF